MIALVIPRHALAVLASVRFLLRVLENENVEHAFAPDAGLAHDERWVASVVAGGYTHGASLLTNVRGVHIALRETAGIRVSLRTVKFLVEDIAVRIDTPALVEG
jgi:hypothetical protein